MEQPTPKPQKVNNRMLKPEHIYWIRLIITLVVVLLASFGVSYLLQRYIARFNLPIYGFAWLAYLTVFGLSIAANLSVIVPVPFAVSIMIATATRWDPVLVALSASVGGAIGELSGYYAGYLGKKLAIPEGVIGYKRIESWIQRYGIWTIFFLAIQPLIPFDIGGFIAGAARMPLHKFLPALWLGKFPKYLLLTYLGAELIHTIPFFTIP